jgi:hypothetical protein
MHIAQSGGWAALGFCGEAMLRLRLASCGCVLLLCFGGAFFSVHSCTIPLKSPVESARAPR